MKMRCHYENTFRYLFSLPFLWANLVVWGLNGVCVALTFLFRVTVTNVIKSSSYYFRKIQLNWNSLCPSLPSLPPSDQYLLELHDPHFFFWCNSPHWARGFSFTSFLDHTQRHTTVGKTPLDYWPARRTEFYLTTHNTHHRQTSMHPVGFESTISASEQPQIYALDRAATGTGTGPKYWLIISAVAWFLSLCKHWLISVLRINCWRNVTTLCIRWNTWAK
jgi:hypothetical protein